MFCMELTLRPLSLSPPVALSEMRINQHSVKPGKRVFAVLFPVPPNPPKISLRRGDEALIFSSIPTGLRPPAQGCEARATLGIRSQQPLNPNGVAALHPCSPTSVHGPR